MTSITLRTEPETATRPKPRAMRKAQRVRARRILITGGAGFLGVNAAVRMIEDGWLVTVLDNLSRPGTELNLKCLHTDHPAEATFIKEDVRNASALGEHVK